MGKSILERWKSFADKKVKDKEAMEQEAIRAKEAAKRELKLKLIENLQETDKMREVFKIKTLQEIEHARRAIAKNNATEKHIATGMLTTAYTCYKNADTINKMYMVMQAKAARTDMIMEMQQMVQKVSQFNMQLDHIDTKKMREEFTEACQSDGMKDMDAMLDDMLLQNIEPGTRVDPFIQRLIDGTATLDDEAVPNTQAVPETAAAVRPEEAKEKDVMGMLKSMEEMLSR